MGYYTKNQYEQSEPPRCLSCDEFKVEVRVRSHVFWECHNPACEECPPKYQVVECSTCGEEYTYGEFCQNCTDGAAVEDPAGHWLDISTNTYKELAELREKQARLTPLAVDVAEVCDCGEPFPESGYCKFCGARERQRH